LSLKSDWLIGKLIQEHVVFGEITFTATTQLMEPIDIYSTFFFYTGLEQLEPQ